MFGSRIACGNTAYKRSETDFYPTPADVTYALLDFLKLDASTKIWECASGNGDMVEAIKARGYRCIGTTIEDGEDYLTIDTPEEVDFIMTNPPFSLAKEFIEKSFERGVPFALLLKSQYWHAKTRNELFYRNPPTYVLPLSWRPDFLFKTRGNGAPLMEVAWSVWIPGKHETLYRPLTRPDK